MVTSESTADLPGASGTPKCRAVVRIGCSTKPLSLLHRQAGYSVVRCMNHPALSAGRTVCPPRLYNRLPCVRPSPRVGRYRGGFYCGRRPQQGRRLPKSLAPAGAPDTGSASVLPPGSEAGTTSKGAASPAGRVEIMYALLSPKIIGPPKNQRTRVSTGPLTRPLKPGVMILTQHCRASGKVFLSIAILTLRVCPKNTNSGIAVIYAVSLRPCFPE